MVMQTYVNRMVDDSYHSSFRQPTWTVKDVAQLGYILMRTQPINWDTVTMGKMNAFPVLRVTYCLNVLCLKIHGLLKEYCVNICERRMYSIYERRIYVWEENICIQEKNICVWEENVCMWEIKYMYVKEQYMCE